MNKNKLKEIIREIVDKVLNEKTYGDTNEATAAQLRYAVKPKPKQSDFRNQIIAAKKMFDAGANEKEVKAKFPQEVINAVNSEASLDEANAPAPSKPKPSPGPAVAPGKPDTGKPKPRRPLGNPEVKPAPKAMNEEEMLKKIVARFKSKDMNESAEQKYSYVKTNKKEDGKIVNVLAAYLDSDGTFTKEKINNLKNKSKFDKWEIDFYKNKQEAESAIKSKK